MSSSYNAGFISLFVVVPRLFSQSSYFRIPRAHFVGRVTLSSFLINFSGYLELNSLLPIAITVFRLIAPPLTRRLWRMALISVTNSSVTIEERPFQDVVKSSTLSWLSQFFWCLIFQSLTVSFLKRHFGYFFDAYLLASGLSYFHTWKYDNPEARR